MGQPGDPTIANALAGAGVSFAVIDSGGYETLKLSDTEARIRSDWSSATYAETLAQWPASIAAVAVSYDDARDKLRLNIGEQIVAARMMFKRRADLGRCMLLKPPGDKPVLDCVDVAPHVADLESFDVIALTEKEAGQSMVERLATITALRAMLTEASLNLPIHVFGGLDPLMTPLYLLAGADIFDGLSWLRYGYRDGHPSCLQTMIAMEHPEMPFAIAEWSLRRANLKLIGDLQIAMQQVAEGASLDAFGRLSERIVSLQQRLLPAAMSA